MVLLKICGLILAVIIGIVVSLIALVLTPIWLPVYLLIQWRIKKRQKKLDKELKEFMRNHPDFSKLFAYTEAKRIELEASPIYIPEVWMALPFEKKIFIADTKIVFNEKYQGKGLGAFAHEIAHIEYFERMGMESCYLQLQSIYPFFEFSCPWEEWWAWIRAEIILDKLGIKIDKQKFWQDALRYIKSHYHSPCPGWEGVCPKKEVMARIKERIMKRMEEK